MRRQFAGQAGASLDPVTGGLRRGGREVVAETVARWQAWSGHDRP